MKKILFTILAVMVMAGSANAAYFIDDFSSFDPLAVSTGTGSVTYNPGQPDEVTLDEFTVSAARWNLMRLDAPDVKTVSEFGISAWGGARYTEVDFKGFGGFSNNVTLGVGSGGYYITNAGSNSWKSFSMTYSGGASNFQDATKLSITFDPDHLGFGKPSILSVSLIAVRLTRHCQQRVTFIDL
jgi:hypothetical protein